MKHLFLFPLLAMICNHADSQVVINLQLPAMGLTVKSQLWNMSVINTGADDIQAQIEVQMTDVSNSQKILSGTSRELTLTRGLNQLTTNLISPVTYNVLSPNYNLDLNQDGFLPVGVFDVCYTVLKIEHGITERLNEQCEQIQIEPISPPMLVSPGDSDRVELTRPLFTWLPPSPFILFGSISYNYTLVEVGPTQSAADAIQQNIPVQAQQDIYTTNLQYPASLPELDTSKIYGWQITALSNGNAVAKSEVWTFRVKKLLADTSQKIFIDYYASLEQEADASYVICKGGILKYAYRNTVNDKELPIHIYDITGAVQKELVLDSNDVDMQYGDNFRQLDLTNRNLTDQHVYLFELTNSLSEHWFLKFQYRKPD